MRNLNEYLQDEPSRRAALGVLGAFGLANAPVQVNPVIEPSVLHEVAQRAGEARLGVGGADDEPVQAGEHDRAGAHRARLEGDIERASVEAP